MAAKVVAEAKWSKIRGHGKSAKPDDFPNGCLPLFSSGILCSDCHSFIVKKKGGGGVKSILWRTKV